MFSNNVAGLKSKTIILKNEIDNRGRRSTYDWTDNQRKQ